MTDNIVVIQARMGSSRLPGKSMMQVGGKPMLDYLIDTLLSVFSKEELIIATSKNTENNIIRDYANSKEIMCFSGDEENVASRYFLILSNHPTKKYLYRICGDSPYYDKEILEKGLRHIAASDELDFISSMPNKGYPMGCNLEVMKTELYLKHFPLFNKKEHFEHVTPYFYENKDSFRHILIACQVEGYAYEKYKFSVDTKEDFEIAKKMLESMNFEPWKYTIKEKFKMQEKLKP